MNTNSVTLSANRAALLVFFSALAVVAAYAFGQFCGAWAILIGVFMLFVVWGSFVQMSSSNINPESRDGDAVLLMVVFILGIWGCWITIHPLMAIALFVFICAVAVHDQNNTFQIIAE